MQKRHLILAAAFVLTSGIAVSQAQQAPVEQQNQPGMMMQQDRPEMMDSDLRRRHGWGRREMGPGMMTMMMIMMDTDGDGALSLQEVQAVHTRMFNYADSNKDGKLTPEELRSFLHGGDFDSDDR
jgi:hypothetical protein